MAEMVEDQMVEVVAYRMVALEVTEQLYLFICLYVYLLTPRPGGGSGIFGGGIGGPPLDPPFGGGFPESIAIASSPWSNVH